MRRTGRHSSISLGLAAWLAVLGAGCGDGPGRDIDAAFEGGLPDARVVDGPMLVDASGDGSPTDGGAGHDAASSDGGRLDAAAACTAAPCDPKAQTGCGVAGVCVLDEGGPRCEASVTGVDEGQPCESTTECAAGLACFDSGDGGVCRGICCPGTAGACGGEGRCREGALVDGSEPGWGMCLPPRACDVLRPIESCDSGEACYIVSPEAETDCRPKGDAGVGEPCEVQQDCAPGLFCGGLTEPTCVRICAVGDGGGPSCPAGEGDCVVYSQSPEGTGLCTAGTMTAW